MEQIVNIHNNGCEINLKARKYKIDVLGGWGVKLGQFSILLRHNLTGKIVECERTFWPLQSYAFEKRAKRIFIANISVPGIYKIEFNQPETIEIKETNLFFRGYFQKPIPNNEISIYIH